MRLSEDRVHSIAEKVAFHLVKKRLVRTKQRLHQVTTWIELPLIEDLKREEEIDAEVAAQLEKLSKKPPQGSFEYQAMFEKKKEEIVRRRGYTI
jgi:hypothetical protein